MGLEGEFFCAENLSEPGFPSGVVGYLRRPSMCWERLCGGKVKSFPTNFEEFGGFVVSGKMGRGVRQENTEAGG